jgi:hypothetical protein
LRNFSLNFVTEILSFLILSRKCALTTAVPRITYTTSSLQHMTDCRRLVEDIWSERSDEDLPEL